MQTMVWFYQQQQQQQKQMIEMNSLLIFEQVLHFTWNCKLAIVLSLTTTAIKKNNKHN